MSSLLEMKPLRFASLIALLALTGCAVTGREIPEQSDLLQIREEADQAYAAERYTEALPIYQSLAEHVPQDADIWFRLGNLHARLNQPYQAIRAYEEALVREPQRTKAWHNLGVIHLRNAANAYSQLCTNAMAGDPLCGHAMETLAGLNALIARKPVPTSMPKPAEIVPSEEGPEPEEPSDAPVSDDSASEGPVSEEGAAPVPAEPEAEGIQDETAEPAVPPATGVAGEPDA